MKPDQQTYFASANSAKGFVSYFNKVFDPEKLEKIYILKGGPGTGKSSLMRHISTTAREKGLPTEVFLCSSDPNSLDGVILPSLSLAILDGTSPHTTDPIYPGIVENIINTGAFWDSEKLYRHKNEIMSLIQAKSKYYKRAYSFLKARGEIEGEIKKIGDNALLREKMENSIKRTSKTLFREKSTGREDVRLITSVSQAGFTKLSTFQQMASSIYVLNDCMNTAYTYLSRLLEEAGKTKQKVIKSFSCLVPGEMDALYFPDTQTAFIIGDRNYELEESGKTYRYINMQRFVEKDEIRANRQKIRFGKKCMEMLLSGAIEAFRDAGKTHEKLEKIYIYAMDFDAYTVRLEKLTKEILKEE